MVCLACIGVSGKIFHQCCFRVDVGGAAELFCDITERDIFGVQRAAAVMEVRHERTYLEEGETPSEGAFCGTGVISGAGFAGR